MQSSSTGTKTRLPPDHGCPTGFLSAFTTPLPKAVHSATIALDSKWFSELFRRGGMACVQVCIGCQDAVSSKELQSVPWKQTLAGTTLWWDDNRKSLSWHPDLRHKESEVPLWLNTHVCVDLQSTMLKATHGTRSISVLGSIPGACDNDAEVGLCTKLCDDGRLAEAVAALDLLLLQRPCSVTSSLFYRLLKMCTQNKALVLGRRIHALTVKAGYEGDVFLATHLIGLYASCARLEEAMRVFSEVSAPDVYNWATIIFAHARHGKAAEAIRLYRLMCESTTLKPDNRLFVAVLKACAAAKDVVAGKEVHSHILLSSKKVDRYVQAALVNMYAKAGSLEYARKLFDELPERDVVTWTTMIAGYAQQGMGQDAVYLYKCMQQEGLSCSNAVTYVCLLQACAGIGVGALDEGKQVHAEVVTRGLHEDLTVAVSLVNMYAKCGGLEDARRLFNKLPERNVVAWNAMIAGYAQEGRGQEALNLYSCMQQEGLSPNSITYVCLLRACAAIGGYAHRRMGHEAIGLYRIMRQQGLAPPNSATYVCLLQACACVGVGALGVGKQLHAEIEACGLQEDSIVAVTLVHMYAKCGSVEDARSLFETLSAKDVVTWTVVIAGYAQQGMGHEALNMYRRMLQEGLTLPDAVTYVCLLQACASVGAVALDQAKQLHIEIKKQGRERDFMIGGSLINMYAKCGSLMDARSLFDELRERNGLAWNAMIAGYAQHELGQEALNLYKSMQQEGLIPDSFTFVSLLQACASIGVGGLDAGKQLHADIEERRLHNDLVVSTSLVNMYAKCGSLGDARRLFHKLPVRTISAWNAMIAGYAQQGTGHEALSLYSSMQQECLSPDCVTYVCMLQACGNIGLEALDVGKQLHAQIEERGLDKDAALGSSLVTMYAKCGRLQEAYTVFERLPHRDVVIWTTMIAGYAQQGMCQDALRLHSRMQQEGHAPDPVTYICLLQACAAVAALPLGERIHAEIEDKEMQAEGHVGAALVHMYAKCGSMYDAQRVFDALSSRSSEAWGALISGYARQGDSEIVFDLLDRMILEGTKPDKITFLGVLTVCSHVGLVSKGWKYFESMRADYGISPTMEHYICMIDLLSRAGHLEEALEVTKTMPFPSSEIVWFTILGACRKWKNIDIGQQAFQGAVSVDETNAAAYVLMANIYASTHMWQAAKEVNARRLKCGAWKQPGQSWWTDMAGVVHTFLARDRMHPEREGIYAKLQHLIPKLKKEGYVPHLDSSLLDIPDDEKEAELCWHSEKLAIAYALNKTAEGTTIRIVKNLRICEDCHMATAYISIVEKRTIICRDASRFHVFKGGECSCGNFW